MASAGSTPDPPGVTPPGLAGRAAPWLALAVLAAVLAAVAVFWRHGPAGDAGLQHWLAVHTGTDNEPGVYYGFWSGFGSVFPWSPLSVAGIFGGVWLWYRRNNCRRDWCWRIGHYDLTDPGTGVTRRVCWRDHPHVARRGISRHGLADIGRRCHLYLGERPGKG